jgi:predicted transcriptional regulator
VLLVYYKKYISLLAKDTAMTAMQLNATKMGIIEMLIGINNEKALAEIEKLVNRAAEENFEYIPGLAYTREERIEAIERAEEDIAAGRVISHEEMGKRIASW